MTDGQCFANNQWQSGTQDAVTMPEPTVDLTTFATWIALQPISVHVSLLELIGNDLDRRHWLANHGA